MQDPTINGAPHTRIRGGAVVSRNMSTERAQTLRGYPRRGAEMRDLRAIGYSRLGRREPLV